MILKTQECFDINQILHEHLSNRYFSKQLKRMFLSKVTLEENVISRTLEHVREFFEVKRNIK